jgi:hypothetical protein
MLVFVPSHFHRVESPLVRFCGSVLAGSAAGNGYDNDIGVTTVAGTPIIRSTTSYYQASGGAFRGPQSLAFDKETRILYVSDQFHSVKAICLPGNDCSFFLLLVSMYVVMNVCHSQQCDWVM